MEGNYNNNDSENASYVTMPTTNQMMPPAALYSTEIPLTSTMLHIDTYTSNFEPNDTFSNMNTTMYTNTTYEPHITATPVVKSHNPISIYTPNQQQQHFMQQQTIFAPVETANMVTNLNNMEIDEYFAPPPPLNMDNAMFTNTMQNVYSPSSTSVTTNNSSIMFMDSSISPSSPINMMSPINQQNMSNSDYPMDSFAPPNYPMLTDNNQMYSEVPIVPTDIGMYPQYNVMPYNDEMMSFPQQQQSPYVERRRPLPRRHTVSTPYNNKDAADNTPDVPQTPTTKSRKSSLKSKRHRSLGKLEMYSSTPDSEQLETWSHQQLLDRIQQLEKEKVVGQNKQDDSGVKSVKSASHSEVEDDDDEDHVCQWDTCSLEFNTLNDLILHVKTDHIGSGKANYYCCWKDCARKQKPFTKRHKMHNHLRTHTGERPFVCEEPDCGKRFSRLDSLTTHSKIHSNIRPYLCSFADCGKAYYHLRSLRKHERSHTAIEKSATPPPPLPTTSFGEENQVFTDWGLSAQAAVLNVMNRDSYV